MVYRITFGIRPGERAWKRELNKIISKNQDAINSILLEYGVPIFGYDLVDRTALRVCADPANIPFTNKKGEGFENKIAELIAAELHLPVTAIKDENECRE